MLHGTEAARTIGIFDAHITRLKELWLRFVSFTESANALPSFFVSKNRLISIL